MENNILNNSYVIGVGTRNLVLNTLGRVYVRVQEKYYELNFKDSSITGGGYGGVIVVETDAQALSLTYPGDNILILSKEGNVYYTQNGIINLFGLDVNNLIDPVITGTLTINNGDKTPIVIQNPILCSNLNAEFLNGYTYDQFAIKEINEQILGEWTFTTDTFIETQLINDSTNTYLDFENSRLVIDYIDVRKGITGIDIVLPDPLIELDENDHLHPVDEAWGFYTEQFISCRGLDVEASGSIGYATEAFVQQSIADLVNGAPETLDTLGEIAAMLSQNDSLLDSLNALLNTHTSQLTTLFSYFDGDAAKKAVELRDITKLWGNDFDGTQKNIDGTLWFNNGSYLMPTNLGHLYTNTGFYSNSFISCRGLDPSANVGSSIEILSSSNLENDFNDDNILNTFNAYTIKLLANRITELENGNGNGNGNGTSGGLIQESDPIFKESAAFNITTSDIDNWNSKWTYNESTIQNAILNKTLTGDFTVTGIVTGQTDLVGGSDIRYKTNISEIIPTLDVLSEISNAPLFSFKWGEKDEHTHIGTAAQYWINTTFKSAVVYDKHTDFYYLSYPTLAYGIGKVNSYILFDHELRIKNLENIVQSLKMQ